MTKEDFFSEENRAKTSWMKFEKIGDAVSGILVGKSFQEGKDGFPNQIVYELKDDDGNYVNVGISEKKTGIHSRLKNAKIGQKVGFKYEQTFPSKTKGYADAKGIGVYVGEVDPAYQVANEFDGQIKDDININDVFPDKA